MTDVTLPTTHPAAVLRFVIESDGKNSAMLLLSDRGQPYAYVGKNGIYVVDSRDQYRVLFVSDVRFLLKCGLAAARADLSITTEADQSRCYIDARRIIRDFARHEHTNKFDPLKRQFRIDTEKGLQLSVNQSREKWRHSFPLRSISVKGNKDIDWELANFQISSGITRSILGLDELFARSVVAETDDAGAADAVLKAIPLKDRKEFAELFADPNVIATSAELAKLCAAKWRVDPERRDSVARRLLALEDSLAAPEKADSNEVSKQLQALYASDLYEHVIYTSEIAGNESSIFAIAGRDPTRGALKAEVVLGAELQNRLYKTLAELVCARQLPESVRGRALDVLAAIGLPDQHKAFTQIEECLKEDQSPTIKLALASARIRQLVATERDVALLRETLMTEDASEQTRGMCLQALLLADATSGVRRECAAPLKFDVEYRNRCMWAAACSREGREVLIEALQTPTPGMPAETALALLDTRVRTTDPEWPSLLAAVKEIALDSAAFDQHRHTAAQIAGKAADEKEFQSRLIRQALAEGNVQLILCTMVHNVSRNDDMLSYLDDMTPLLKSKDLEPRLLVAVLVAGRCAKPIPPEYRAAVQKFVDAIEATKDPKLEEVARTITDRLMAQQ